MQDCEAAQTIRKNLAAVRKQIELSCERSRRLPSDVALVAVTKYVSASAVRHLHTAGIRSIGENTIQETVRKREALSDLKDLLWHMVGHLQRNKVPKALELFETVHSLDSVRLAETLGKRLASRPGQRPKFFVEVNVGAEPSKGGVPPEGLLPFLREVRQKTSLGEDLVGLMTVAPLAHDPEDIRPYFRRLREFRDQAADSGLLSPDAGLSMGMSNDFPVAIEEGATVVRIGSRLFEGIPH